jgi:hypothetical protein
MVEAGFVMVFVGIETPDAQALALTGKTQNLREDILTSVRRIQAHGLEVTGGFIVGFDGESDDIFERQRAIQTRCSTAMVLLMAAQYRLARRLPPRDASWRTAANTHHLRLNPADVRAPAGGLQAAAGRDLLTGRLFPPLPRSAGPDAQAAAGAGRGPAPWGHGGLLPFPL